ncbi:hypothetical protein [Spirosoma rhododendri]|uniref:Uncharacterized protein n=1 Tax=Spirosoma rhododendri TaxID=2728024 RepID=A0A7L5DL44_9BACT|nr:hypothetical protein [Spirosoma rhododendri]QJD79189.1 hypothetical protein HH216_12760 [Spirosoma rhododendri]
MTIQVEVQDDLVQQLGVGAIRGLLEEELAYQRFRLLDERVQTAMQDRPDVNWDAEFEQARQLAFNEYQQRRQRAL